MSEGPFESSEKCSWTICANFVNWSEADDDFAWATLTTVAVLISTSAADGDLNEKFGIVLESLRVGVLLESECSTFAKIPSLLVPVLEVSLGLFILSAGGTNFIEPVDIGPLSGENRVRAGASAGRRDFGDWLSLLRFRRIWLSSDDDPDDEGRDRFVSCTGSLLLCSRPLGVELLSRLELSLNEYDRPLDEFRPSSRFGLCEWLLLCEDDVTFWSLTLGNFLECFFFFCDKSSNGISCDVTSTGDGVWRAPLPVPVCWLNVWYANASSAISTWSGGTLFVEVSGDTFCSLPEVVVVRLTFCEFIGEGVEIVRIGWLRPKIKQNMRLDTFT